MSGFLVAVNGVVCDSVVCSMLWVVVDPSGDRFSHGIQYVYTVLHSMKVVNWF